MVSSTKTGALVNRFSVDRRANVSIIFALSFVPMVLLAGTAIDYSRAVAEKTTIQQIVDSAALQLAANTANYGATAAAMKTKAQTVVNALAGIHPVTVASATIDTSIYEICITATEQVATTLMQIVQINAVPVSARGCSRPQGHFEIALVLDNTGSMTDSAGSVSKMQALVSATQSLVSIMQPSGLSTPISSFSIVPFSSAVNIGASYAGQSFMDTGAQSSIHWQHYAIPLVALWKPASRFAIYSGMNATWRGCVEERPYPYTITDTPATAGNPDTLFVPYLYPDEPGNNNGTASYYNSGNNYYSYNTYLTDSAGVCLPADTYALADAADAISKGSGLARICKYKNQNVANANTGIGGNNGNASQLYPAGPSLGCEAQPILTLTENMSSVTAAINAMTPSGDTNILSGLMWGWRTISPNGPFNNTANVSGGPRNAASYTNQSNTKVIVLMTDGANHWVTTSGMQFGSVYNAFGYYADNRLSPLNGNVATTASNYRAQMDGATLAACQNARAAGILVYTVGLSVPNFPIDAQGLSLLQNCAGTPQGQNSTMAFVSQSSTELTNQFQQIARSLSQLRLTR